MNSLIERIHGKHLLEKGHITFIFSLLTIIIMPIHVKFIPPFMVLWGLGWLLERRLFKENAWEIQTSYGLLFALFIVYYLWQAIGLIYTSDIKMGLSNLFGRLSLLLFPTVVYFSGESIKNKITILLRVFTFSTFLFILFCFINACYRSVSFQNGIWSFNPVPAGYPWLNYFYGSDLTITNHPSYIAMYGLLSTFICFESWFDYSIKYLQRVFWLIVGILLLVSQYFLSSRAGIFASLILVTFYFIRKFKTIEKRKYIRITAAIFLFLIVLIPVILNNQRVDYLFGRYFVKESSSENYRKEDPRFLIWSTALKVAQQNLIFGVGIGDVRSELAAGYNKIGEKTMANGKYNAHNQFLEILIENGIIGLVIFIAIMGVMIYIAYMNHNLLYGLFIIMMLIFFMFETVLYRLAGVTFFSLFSFLLILKSGKGR